MCRRLASGRVQALKTVFTRLRISPARIPRGIAREKGPEAHTCAPFTDSGARAGAAQRHEHGPVTRGWPYNPSSQQEIAGGGFFP